MLILALSALALLSPLLVGRWPAGLLLRQWRWPALVWLALALQVALFSFGFAESFAPYLHLLTYAAAIGFVWLNREVLGVVIVGVGALSNGITIALNGGTLPASPQAVAAAGLDTGDAFANSAVLDDPVLPWLGDIFAWPEPLPLANTFSVGDILIVLGVFVAVWVGTRRIGSASHPKYEAAPVDDEHR